MIPLNRTTKLSITTYIHNRKQFANAMLIQLNFFFTLPIHYTFIERSINLNIISDGATKIRSLLPLEENENEDAEACICRELDRPYWQCI